MWCASYPTPGARSRPRRSRTADAERLRRRRCAHARDRRARRPGAASSVGGAAERQRAAQRTERASARVVPHRRRSRHVGLRRPPRAARPPRHLRHRRLRGADVALRESVAHDRRARRARVRVPPPARGRVRGQRRDTRPAAGTYRVESREPLRASGVASDRRHPTRRRTTRRRWLKRRVRERNRYRRGVRFGLANAWPRRWAI